MEVPVALFQYSGMCFYVPGLFSKIRHYKRIIPGWVGLELYIWLSSKSSQRILCQMWERTSLNTLGFFYDQALSVLCFAAVIPHCHTKTDDAFSGNAIEVHKHPRRDDRSS